jgi:hypothetical protein
MVTGAVRQDVMLTSGLPVLGSLFYFHGIPLSAVAYNVQGTVSPDAHIVEFEYDDVEFEKAESCTLEQEEEQYPVYLPESYTEIVNRGSPNSTVRYKDKWVLKVLKFANYRQQLAITLFLRQWGPDQRAQILREMGKIHKFQGYFWLFKGANVDREGPERYRVVYRWVSDPGFSGQGVLSFMTPLSPEIIVPLRPLGDMGDDLLRAPFDTYLTVPQKSDPTANPPVLIGKPRIFIIAPTNVNENGHLQLPGVPIG